MSHSQVKEESKSLNTSAVSEFDPIGSIEKEDYDLRDKQKPVITPIQPNKPIQIDKKFELKNLKFKTGKFILKIYDALSK